MKLNFTIHYHTEWGQSLHVAICYFCSDGHQFVHNYPMQTQDGELWMIETSVVESRQHYIVSFEYVYQVEDTDGKVLRQEWNIVPRKYAFSVLTNYLFADNWRDIPSEYDLYTLPYTILQPFLSISNPLSLQIPLFRKTIIFRVTAPQIRKGEVLAILGGHPTLGNWNDNRFVKMNFIGCHEWTLSLNADMLFSPVEYKYVVVDEESNLLKIWEDGENRTTGQLNLNDGEALVQRGELRLEATVLRAAGLIVHELSHELIDWAQRVGFKVLKLQRKEDPNQPLLPSKIKHFIEISNYAHSKNIVLMGQVKVDLCQERPSKYVGRRLAFLEKIFDALSLSFIFPESALGYKDYLTYLMSERLEQMMKKTSMLLCLENQSLSEYLDLSLKGLQPFAMSVLSSSEEQSHEFAHVESYPVKSIAAISNLDTSSLRSWWNTDPDRAMRYFITVLHKKGKAPNKLTPAIAEEMIARYMYSSSAISLFTLNDLCQMDKSLHDHDLSIHALMKAETMISKLQSMVKQSKR